MSGIYALGKKYNSRLIKISVILGMLLLIISFLIFLKKFPEQTKKVLHKLNPKNWNKKKNNSTDTPDWIKHTKDKEKTK